MIVGTHRHHHCSPGFYGAGAARGKVVRGSLALIVVLLLAAGSGWTVIAQSVSGPSLLAFHCVDLTAGQPVVIELERESFPSFTDTGLFTTRRQQLLYVEQGRLTVFTSDLPGPALAVTGASLFADTETSLGVRNDDLDGASVLWVRLVENSDVGVATRFAFPQVIRTLRDIQTPPSLFADVELPSLALKQGNLFLAQIALPPFAVDTSPNGPPLLTSGAVAVVVDSGTLNVNAMRPQPLFPGEAALIDLDHYRLENAASEAATAFLVGIAAPNDQGQIGQTIARAPDGGRTCPV